MDQKRAEIGTDVEKAAVLLKQGKLVAIPTETVYGLAANALDEEAILNIFSVKNRPFFDPLIIHISSHAALEKYVEKIPVKAKQLISHFWPGPLTLVLPKRDIIPDLITSGHSTVAIRMPAHPQAQKLLSLLDFPLAAPSANPFGYVSPTSAKHVYDQLGNKLDYILDGGNCTIGLESTIIGFNDEAEPQILRLGGISQEDIEKVTGKVVLQLNQASRPDAPGQLSSHYSPKTPLFIGNIESLLHEFKEKRIGVISFATDYKEIHTSVAKQWILSRNANINEAAKNLFRFLREADTTEIDIILTEYVPENGLGNAINDRLLRASVR